MGRTTSLIDAWYRAVSPLTNFFGWLLLPRADVVFAKEISDANLFARDWYLKVHPLVEKRQTDPLLHFVKAARTENPNALFDSAWYLARYPDVATSGWIPVVHYLRHGAAEGRNPSKFFDTRRYLEFRPDVAMSGVNPLGHFLAAPAQLIDRAPLVPTVDATLLRDVNGLHESNPTPYYNQFAKMVAANGADRLHGVLDGSLQFGRDRPQRAELSGGALVSIVIPVWNQADLVGDAIESVLAQTYPRFELLVCNDGSSDDTRKVIGTYRDERITVISYGKQKGVAAARNSCLSRAKGKYVAYLDAANLWHPRFLEAAVEALERDEEKLACYADHFELRIDAEGLTLADVDQKPFDFESLIHHRTIDLNSFVHRADAWKALGMFRRDLPGRENQEFLIRLAWLRDPAKLEPVLNIRRRIPFLGEAEAARRSDSESLGALRDIIHSAANNGLEVKFPKWLRRVAVLSCHCSSEQIDRAQGMAAALSRHFDVKLITFMFPVDTGNALPTPPPPAYSAEVFQACDFPEFFGEMSKALNVIRGDLVYALKPNLPSFGLALMENYHRGTPIMLEVGDREVSEGLPTSWSGAWAEMLDSLIADIPVLFTDRRDIYQEYGGKCLPRYQPHVDNANHDVVDKGSTHITPDERHFGAAAALLNLALGAHRLEENATYEVSQSFANALAAFRNANSRTS